MSAAQPRADARCRANTPPLFIYRTQSFFSVCHSSRSLLSASIVSMRRFAFPSLSLRRSAASVDSIRSDAAAKAPDKANISRVSLTLILSPLIRSRSIYMLRLIAPLWLAPRPGVSSPLALHCSPRFEIFQCSPLIDKIKTDIRKQTIRL